MTITKRPFGRTKQGRPVECYTLKDGHMGAEILTYGAAIRSLVVPAGVIAHDVALGYDDIEGYESDGAYLGSIIGRYSNRIGNARFALGGKEYTLDQNDGTNTLHGGFNGFDKKVWEAREHGGALVLALHEKDLECGFPGNLDVEVRYSIKDNALTIEYKAVCDADTPINLTNHCYFNLGGHSFGNIKDHNIRILADHITPIDEILIPTGDLMDVTGTPFDLRELTEIEPGLASDHPQIELGGGYDINFVLSEEPCRELSPAAVLEYDGLRMTCLTTCPGIQFYSGNVLTAVKAKGGVSYHNRSALCLETQGWPDAVNKPGFPDSILRKGNIYSHKTVYAFEMV